MITKKTIMNRFKPGDKARVKVEVIDGPWNGLYLLETPNGSIWAKCCDLEPIEPVQEEESPAIEDYMVNLETAAAEYYASPNLFRYTQAVDNYVDNLLATISRLKSEIDELKNKS